MQAADSVNTVDGQGVSPDLLVSVRLIERPATVILPPTATVRQAIERMQANRNGSVTVVDGAGHLVGILTEMDVLRRLDLEADPSRLGAPLSQVMTATPRTLPQEANLAQVMHLMAIGGFRHVPIVDEQRMLLGVVSFLDVLAYIHGRPS